MREVNLPLPNLITSSCKAKAVLLRVPKSPLMVQKVPERYWSKIFPPYLSVNAACKPHRRRGSLSVNCACITCAVRRSSTALSRTSCSGHDLDSRSRCRRVCLRSRSEPCRSRSKHWRTPWLNSSRAALRSPSSLLHNRAKLFEVGPASDSDSDRWPHERRAAGTPPGLLPPLAWQVAAGLLAMSRSTFVELSCLSLQSSS